MDATISFRDVRIGFDEGDIIRSLSFDVQERETLVLLGETGTGKTLSLKMAAGLLRPLNGAIKMLGQEVTGMSERELLDFRREIGFGFQEGALFDSLTVEENVAFRLREEKVRKRRYGRVLEALRFVGWNTPSIRCPGIVWWNAAEASIAQAIIASRRLYHDSPTAGSSGSKRLLR
jgi:phospholipid/cholesterol/gamma-HCH transport system ATP-binding protein